jgi:cytochrome c1
MEPKPGSGVMTGGDAEKLALGKAAFTGKGTCFACHTIQGVSTIGTTGPELTHIGTEGPMHKPGMSPEAYIRESIEKPGAFVAPGFLAGVMPADIRKVMTDQEFEALVAFLVAQK